MEDKWNVSRILVKLAILSHLKCHLSSFDLRV